VVPPVSGKNRGYPPSGSISGRGQGPESYIYPLPTSYLPTEIDRTSQDQFKRLSTVLKLGSPTGTFDKILGSEINTIRLEVIGQPARESFLDIYQGVLGEPLTIPDRGNLMPCLFSFQNEGMVWIPEATEFNKALLQGRPIKRFVQAPQASHFHLLLDSVPDDSYRAYVLMVPVAAQPGYFFIGVFDIAYYYGNTDWTKNGRVYQFQNINILGPTDLLVFRSPKSQSEQEKVHAFKVGNWDPSQRWIFQDPVLPADAVLSLPAFISSKFACICSNF
jgi:hypothetical protein